MTTLFSFHGETDMGEKEIQKVRKEIRHRIDETTAGKRQLELLKLRIFFLSDIRHDNIADLVIT